MSGRYGFRRGFDTFQARHRQGSRIVERTFRRGIAFLEELPPETVAEGVRELESDDAVELLEGLPEESQEEILGRIPPVRPGRVEDVARR